MHQRSNKIWVFQIRKELLEWLLHYCKLWLGCTVPLSDQYHHPWLWQFVVWHHFSPVQLLFVKLKEIFPFSFVDTVATCLIETTKQPLVWTLRLSDSWFWIKSLTCRCEQTIEFYTLNLLKQYLLDKTKIQRLYVL